MPLKTWQLTTQGGWNTGSNWSGGTIPAAGDDAYFTTDIASQTAGVVTASVTDIQPATILFADGVASFFPWQLTGSSNINTFGTGTNVIVRNAPAFIWNNIAGSSRLIVSSSGPEAYLALSGSSNTFTGGVQILTGTLSIAADTSLGPVPGTVFSSSIIFNSSSALMVPSSSPYISPPTRGIFLSGSAIMSSSATGAGIDFDIRGPITGSGQLAFTNGQGSGSVSFARPLSVYLTGTNSSLLNTGGIRLDGHGTLSLYTSGSRSIQSAPIEFRYKGSGATSGGSSIFFYQDPLTSSHTITGDISWTGGANAGDKTISSMLGRVTSPQTHNYAGRLITQETNASSVYIGTNSPTVGGDMLLTVRLLGDNSGLRGSINPAFQSYSSVHFVGSQSLPNPSATLIGNHTTAATASDGANWVFSGSMTIPNQLRTSNNSTGVGARLNVTSGSIVTATGVHGITGSLTRRGSAPNLAWYATSFVGPGEWIQSGTITGAGSLVVEPGSRLTLANTNNLFTGPIYASNGFIALASGMLSGVLGAAPASPIAKLQLLNSTLAVSSSISFNPNHVLSISGSSRIDIVPGATLTVPDIRWGMYSSSSLSNPATNLAVTGGGSLSVTSLRMLPWGMWTSYPTPPVSYPTVVSRSVGTDLDWGTAPVSIDPINVQLNSGESVDIRPAFLGTFSGLFASHPNRGISLSGPATLSSSYPGHVTFDIQGPITGTGQLTFDNTINSGSTGLYNTVVWLTGTNSQILNSGGVRLRSTSQSELHVSGSRTIGSSSIEFMNKGAAAAAAVTTLRFYEDPATQVHTMSGDISWTGRAGTGTKTISSLGGTFSQPQKHIYSGRLITQDTNASDVNIGPSSLLDVILTGNNGNLRGRIVPGHGRIHFVGSQSLPHPSAQIVGSYTSAGTGSNNANVIFSGSMTVSNPLETSLDAPGIGMKLNVQRGDTVTATGRHGLTGSVTRIYSTTDWRATSLVGPGEWIQQGVLAGAGGLVIEPGSRLTLANTNNRFSGVISASNGVLTLASGMMSGVLGAAGTSPAIKVALQNSTLAVSSSVTFNSNHAVSVNGSSAFDISPGATLTVPDLRWSFNDSNDLSIPSTNLTITGGGSLSAPNLKTLPWGMWPGYPTPPAGFTTVLSRSVGADLDFGPAPAVLDPVNVQLKSGEVVDVRLGSLGLFKLHPNRGIFLSGSATLSSSVSPGTLVQNSFDILAPITGTGQLTFDTFVASGSSTLNIGINVWATGSNSTILNSGGIRLDSTSVGADVTVNTSGSRNIGSASIEFRNKGSGAASSLGVLNFYEDPSTQVHTMSGDISWTGRAGTGTKAISSMQGTISSPQTHIYAGRLSTQETNTSDVRLGINSPTVGADKLLKVILTGDNSGLRGRILPANLTYASVHFVGSQSLPHPSSQLVGGHQTESTASDGANWVFSGSMSVPNGLETSINTVGAKLNVAAGNTVTATGRHGISGSLTRRGAVPNLAWNATSFVGPGEWIQSGTLAGAGSLVLEPGSRLTLATNANTFTGIMSASNGTITVGPGAGDLSFGAVPGTRRNSIQLTQGASLALSTSLSLNANRQVAITGSGVFDIPNGMTLTMPLTMSVATGSSNAITVIGGGTLSVGQIDVTGSVGFNVAAGSNFTLPNITSFGGTSIHTIDFTNSQNLIMPLTATMSSTFNPFSPADNFHILGEIPGSGVVEFKNPAAGSGTTSVYITGSSSKISNAGGISFASRNSNGNYLYVTGSRSFDVGQVLFSSGSSAGYNDALYFYEDLGAISHTIPSVIKSTSPNTLTLSRMVSGLSRRNEHVYSGTLIASGTGPINIGYNQTTTPGARLDVKLTGDNSQVILPPLAGFNALWGGLSVGSSGYVSTHFVGQQSLPHYLTPIFASTWADVFPSSYVEDGGNLIFSGTMTVQNDLKTSAGIGTVGAKINVASGDTVTATGRHTINGAISSVNVSYAGVTYTAMTCTSFVGPGRWIQSGVIAGPGGIRVETGSNLTIANSANTFSGGLVVSGGLLTISAGAADTSFGSVPGSVVENLRLVHAARAAFSASFSMHQNRRTSVTGSGGTFDIESGKTVTHQGPISGDGRFVKDGTGTLILSGTGTFSGGTRIMAGTLDAASSIAIPSGTVVVDAGAVLKASNTLSSQVLDLKSSLILSGCTIQIG